MVKARKAMGLSPPSVPVVSHKLAWFLSWFTEIRIDREYLTVADTAIERPLTANIILPYYDLIGADEVMPKHDFFALIRKIDSIWLSALQSHKTAKSKTKRPNTKGSP